MARVEKPKRRSYQPPVKKREAGSNQQLYHSKRWRAARSQAMRRANYNCEAHKAIGWIKEGRIGDHIIPIIHGGHPTHPDNILILCKNCHDGIKSNLERRAGKPLVPYKGEEGFRVPVDRKDIIRLLVEKLNQ